MTPEQWRELSGEGEQRKPEPTQPLNDESSTVLFQSDPDSTATMSSVPRPPQRPTGSLPEGELIAERYAIGAVIGEGGFGKVYIAQDRRLDNRKVVVKTLKAAQEGWHEKRFQDEVRALARMDHPGIVGVMDSGRMPDGSAFLVMQYVPGEGLDRLLRKGPIDTHRGIKFLAQMAEALSIAHDAGILHRDLKPANVIIRDAGKPEERATLIDFGIARTDAADTHAQTSVVSGTPKYMAPEQFIGRTSVSSDLFTLGLIAVELLTGEIPERRTGVEDLRSPARSALSKINPPIPQPIVEAIVKTVAPVAEERWQSVREFAQALARSAADRPKVPMPPPAELARTRVAPPSKSHSRRLGAVAALFVVLVAAGAYWAAKSPPPHEPDPVTITAVLGVRGTGASPRPVGTGEVLQAGDKLQVELQTTQPGFLYLFDESRVGTAGAPQFAVLFPGGGGASPAISPTRRIRIPTTPNDWFNLDGSSPEETLWLVWSRQPVRELEEMQKYSNPPQYGLIPRESSQQLQQYLSAAKLSSSTENATDKSIVWREATNRIVAKLRLTVR